MARGRGSLYKQPRSPYWWVSYYVNGKQVRESTKTEDKKKAQKILAEKVAAGRVPDKRSIGKLLDGLIADYENNHRKGLSWCKIVVEAHLRVLSGRFPDTGRRSGGLILSHAASR